VSGRCRQRGWRVGRDVDADADTPPRASQNPARARRTTVKLFVTRSVSALYAGKLEGARDLKVALDDVRSFCTVRVGLPSLGLPTRSFAVLTLTSVPIRSTAAAVVVPRVEVARVRGPRCTMSCMSAPASVMSPASSQHGSSRKSRCGTHPASNTHVDPVERIPGFSGVISDTPTSRARRSSAVTVTFPDAPSRGCPGPVQTAGAQISDRTVGPHVHGVQPSASIARLSRLQGSGWGTGCLRVDTSTVDIRWSTPSVGTSVISSCHRCMLRRNVHGR
jgi:hypothetical protein